MKCSLRLLAILLCANTLVNADNFVQATPPPTEPKIVVKVPPLSSFDETLQQEMKKYPQGSMFFVDGKTGKVLSVNQTPNIKSSAKNPGKFYPREADAINPQKPSEIVPYKMQEEHLNLL